MKIEIWSDFVCPFCYIGKRRLEKALSQFKHSDQVNIEYKSYQLDPNAEYVPGKSFYDAFAELKGITREQAVQMNQQVAEHAQLVGLSFHFDTMKYANTFDAHRIAKYAREQGKEKEFTEAVFHAYFTASQVISDSDMLVELAGQVGLDQSQVAQVLASDQYADQVRAEINKAYQLGVRGVPFFVLNDQYAISGAQSEDFFLQAIEKVWQEEQATPTLKSLQLQEEEPTTCTDEGCDIKSD